jgi:hypothetical protein
MVVLIFMHGAVTFEHAEVVDCVAGASCVADQFGREPPAAFIAAQHTSFANWAFALGPSHSRHKPNEFAESFGDVLGTDGTHAIAENEFNFATDGRIFWGLSQPLAHRKAPAANSERH